MINKKSKMSKIKLSVVVICAGLLSIIGSKIYIASINPQIETYSLAETNQVMITSDTNMAFDIEDMYSASDIIVVGEYISFDSTWNTARNTEDITLEDPRFYSEGWIYDFNVTEVLKGNSDTGKIKVSHYYSNSFDVELSNAVVDEIGNIIEPATEISYHPVTVYNEDFIEPELGATYMLFLRYNDELDMHFGAIQPSSIKFDNQSRAFLQQNKITAQDTTIIQIEDGEARVVDSLEINSYSSPQINKSGSDIYENQLIDNINSKNLDELKKEIASF